MPRLTVCSITPSVYTLRIISAHGFIQGKTASIHHSQPCWRAGRQTGPHTADAGAGPPSPPVVPPSAPGRPGCGLGAGDDSSPKLSLAGTTADRGCGRKQSKCEEACAQAGVERAPGQGAASVHPQGQRSRCATRRSPVGVNKVMALRVKGMPPCATARLQTYGTKNSSGLASAAR